MNTISLLGRIRTVSYSNVKMLVFDMAGTTVNEHGIVYKTMYETLSNYGLGIKPADLDKWHGVHKYEVFEHFLSNNEIFNMHNDSKQEMLKNDINDRFNKSLKEKYFSSDEISLIHEDLPLIFNNIRKNDIKIALNTGYNKDIQHLIIKKLSMNEFIDDYISSEEVPKGRPYPFMINTLMERNGIENPNEVIKFGDTKVDVLEGINANCLASVGVLSGADKENMLTNSTIVIEDVTKIKL